MRRRMTSFSTASKARESSCTSRAASADVSSGFQASSTCFLTSATAWERACFSRVETASRISPENRALILSINRLSGLRSSNCIMGRPTCSAQAWMTPTCFLMASWATSRPARMSCSLTSWAPASTMPMASAVPATIRLTGLRSISS